MMIFTLLWGIGITAILAVGVGIAVGIYRAGEKAADARCDVAKWKSRYEQSQTQVKNLTARLGNQEKVNSRLTEEKEKADREALELAGELAKAKLQSTEKGAKNDPNAFLTTDCALTPRGARGMR